MFGARMTWLPCPCCTQHPRPHCMHRWEGQSQGPGHHPAARDSGGSLLCLVTQTLVTRSLGSTSSRDRLHLRPGPTHLAVGPHLVKAVAPELVQKRQPRSLFPCQKQSSEQPLSPAGTGRGCGPVYGSDPGPPHMALAERRGMTRTSHLHPCLHFPSLPGSASAWENYPEAGHQHSGF